MSLSVMGGSESYVVLLYYTSQAGTRRPSVACNTLPHLVGCRPRHPNQTACISHTAATRLRFLCALPALTPRLALRRKCGGGAFLPPTRLQYSEVALAVTPGSSRHSLYSSPYPAHLTRYCITTRLPTRTSLWERILSISNH
jgi:hypothetical protein